jgi:hypothetical protein
VRGSPEYTAEWVTVGANPLKLDENANKMSRHCSLVVCKLVTIYAHGSEAYPYQLPHQPK